MVVIVIEEVGGLKLFGFREAEIARSRSRFHGGQEREGCSRRGTDHAFRSFDWTNRTSSDSLGVR